MDAHSDNATTNTNGIRKKDIDRLVAGQHMFPFSFPFPTQTDPALDATSISPLLPRPVSNSAPSPTFDKDTEMSKRKSSRRSTSASDDPSSQESHVLDHPLGSVFMMPQTFMEKGIESNVAYDFSVRIVHGILKTTSK
jgi:hypothetical protein